MYYGSVHISIFKRGPGVNVQFLFYQYVSEIALGLICKVCYNVEPMQFAI